MAKQIRIKESPDKAVLRSSRKSQSLDHCGHSDLTRACRVYFAGWTTGQGHEWNKLRLIRQSLQDHQQSKYNYLADSTCMRGREDRSDVSQINSEKY